DGGALHQARRGRRSRCALQVGARGISGGRLRFGESLALAADLAESCGAVSFDFSFDALAAKYDWVRALEACPQDPEHHGEGNVFIHTRMVLDELVRSPAFCAQSPEHQAMLFMAALLHDVAKPACT